MTDNLAHAQLKAYIRRIESVEDEIAALNSDKSEIYKEAKSNGFNSKTLRKVVQKRRVPAVERQEQDAEFELYWDAIHGASDSLAHAHVENIEEFPAEKPDPFAQFRADPAMAIVDPSTLKKSEPQPTKAAGSDLASRPQGQVATHSPETADQSTDASQEHAQTATGLGAGGDNLDQGSRPTATAKADVPSDQGEASGGGQSQDNSGVRVASVEPSYAAPGVIVWETSPPEGVERSAISTAFGAMGQDAAVISDDLEKGRAQPIVKKGNVILDGWARYMAVRNMRELDGSPVAYPVVQYDGDDLLTDIIRMNVEGRILTEDQKRKIAANLARQEPARKDDIYRAFEIWMEPV